MAGLTSLSVRFLPESNCIFCPSDCFLQPIPGIAGVSAESTETLAVFRHLVNRHSPSLNLVVFESVFGGYRLARARMTRSELKAQDEITTTLQGFGDMAIARKKELLMGVIAVAVVLIAYFGWSAYSSRQAVAS